MRKSELFLLILAAQVVLLVLLFGHAFFRTAKDAVFLEEKREMMKSLGLADLCLFTEASYTRHLTQADLHTPFQDSPLSLEHFPSGALVRPPAALRKLNEKLD
jgi:hypothetical protein